MRIFHGGARFGGATHTARNRSLGLLPAHGARVHARLVRPLATGAPMIGAGGVGGTITPVEATASRGRTVVPRASTGRYLLCVFDTPSGVGRLPGAQHGAAGSRGKQESGSLRDIVESSRAV